ncbi:MAG TPA: S24/S26 family peptidase [Terriglobales bacterium]|nr:S24/S26 family peptidase [Terriglobales bacterium]
MLDATTSAARLDWNAERSALVADVLRGNPGSRQTVRLRVHGESMLPTLWPGDVVEIESCSLAVIRPGDIALAHAEGRLFLHRFVELRSPEGFVMRGDSMPAMDPQFPSEALIGRLVRRVSIHQSTNGQASELPIEVTPQADLNSGLFGVVLSRALGFVFCHFGAIRRLALKLHRRRSLWASELRSAGSGAELESVG